MKLRPEDAPLACLGLFLSFGGLLLANYAGGGTAIIAAILFHIGLGLVGIVRKKMYNPEDEEEADPEYD